MLLTLKSVVVEFAVDEPMAKSVLPANCAVDEAWIERSAYGEVEPIPKPVLVQRVTSCAPTIALMFPWTPAPKPVFVSLRLVRMFGAVTEVPTRLRIPGEPAALPNNPLELIVKRFVPAVVNTNVAPTNPIPELVDPWKVYVGVPDGRVAAAT